MKKQTKPKTVAYRIETERLVIRCYQTTDAFILKTAVDQSIEHLKEFMPWAWNEPQPIEDKIALLRMFRGKFDLDKDYTMGIFNKEETELIGGTGFHARIGANAFEIGYWINVNHINQGYATENVKALTKVGFEVFNIGRIEIHCDEANKASARVIEKAEYRYETTARRRQSNGHGRMIYSLFPDEYPTTAAAQFPVKAYDAMGRRVL